jgi:hypothetical protein
LILISRVHEAMVFRDNSYILVSTWRRAAFGNDIAQMYACVVFTDEVFEVVNVLSAVGVADVDNVVTGKDSVFNSDNLGVGGAEERGEDHKRS